MDQDARDLIERIRSERSIELDGKVASILTNALEVLSYELYDTDTHFLLELLQNADDTKYDAGVTPTWTITYRPGSLRVDCNETGFTASNVEAICTIRGSTKQRRDSAHGFTGEKGIGFKSVFKAAEVVWISSNAYSFKFDKRERLGVICPLWATFPEVTSPKTTSMFFQLGNNHNEDLLEKQLREFDPLQLIFLRRIRRIHLRVEKRVGSTLNRNLQRVDHFRDGQVVTELTFGEKMATYVVVRHQIQQLPKEPRRHNCTQSELALAFPTADASTVCECSTQNVYATLPIRDYGLKFLLHGDFVLTASRLEIETSLAWNKALRDNVADAFLAAVDNLNEGPMQYIWPYFVPGPETSPFFEPARSTVMEGLKQRKVLLTFAKKMAEPSKLFYIDLTKFADEEGIPFTLASHTEDLYLSPVYRPCIVDTFSSTGLRRLSETDFLEHLCLMISSDQESFCKRPLQWHSALALRLIHLQSDPSFRSKIKELPIIPICGGNWVSASSKPVFIDGKFPALSSGVRMPKIVDPIVAKASNRWILFSTLGVCSSPMSDLCDYIIEAHASSEFDPDNYTRAELISHAKFLIENYPLPVGKIDIWFATSTDKRCRGSRLYMREAFQLNSPESRVFDQLSRQLSVIHDDYLSEFSTQDARNYLKDSLHVWSIPRLVEHESENSFNLSNDFKALFQACQPSDILQVLCNHWRQYSLWIVKDGQESQSRKGSRLSVVGNIRKIVVQTRVGPSMLQETMLSGLDHNVEDEVLLPILDLEVHDDFARQGLKKLGITVEAGIHYYLTCLRYMQREDSPRKEVVTYLYERIQNDCIDHERLVMDFFKTNRSVYVEFGERDTTESVCWITIEECANREVNLETRYPTCRRLFGGVLGPEQTQINHWLADAESINVSTRLTDILHIFTGISRAIGAMDPLKAIHVVKPLTKKNIMPVKKPDSTLPFELVAPEDGEWFIADQMYLQESFYDKVSLLAFSVDDILRIKQLLQSLNPESRNLSQRVQTLSTAKAPFKHCDIYEKFLRDRVTFIQELIPNSNSGRETLIGQLQSISVRTAAAVVQEYTLEYGSTKVYGLENEADVCSSFDDTGMRLFLRNRAFRSQQTIWDIGDAIAQYCQIKDTGHLRLLYETLGDCDTQTLQTRFAKIGIHVSVPAQGMLLKRHRARTGDILPLPYPLSHDGDYFGNQSNNTYFRSRKRRKSGQSGSDRRLPMLNMADVHFDIPGMYYMRDQLDPNSDLQFTGQYMASQFLEASLGPVYDRVRHWTSELRTRVGLCPPEICDNQTAFTMAGSSTCTEVIDFLCRYGFDRVKHWRGILQVVHFEVVTSESATGSPFVCSWSQIQSFRRYRLDGSDQCPREVVILLRVKNVYTRPQFEISINPWDLFCSESWLIQGDGIFSVSMEGRQTNAFHSLSGSQTATPSSKIFVSSPQNAVDDGTEATSMVDVRTDLPKNLDPGYAEQLIRSTGSSQNMSAFIDMQEWANHGYVHSNLDDKSFRVFILFPGSQGDALRGEICTIPSNSDQTYRALSYVWGPENQPTHTILTPDGILTIKASLNDALLTLRQKSSRVYLWIDAICIDQTDAKEKAHQIRLLPRIFQNASRTIVFLGADRKSNDAIITLMQINAKSVCDSNVEDWPKDLPHPPSTWEGRSMPGPESQVWTDVMAFFRRPWFRRAWIVQEAVAAPTVTMVCGGLAFDWNDLFKAMKLVDHKMKISYENASSWRPFMTLGLHREREAEQIRYPLAQLLHFYRHVHSSLARDRFFALLGLASDGNNPEYALDYNASFEDIVVKIAQAFVAQGRGITLLNAAGLGSQPDRFPSWVPDWTVTTAGNLANSILLGVSFNASNDSEEDIDCGDEPGTLAVKGHLVDEITTVNKSPNNTEDQKRYFRNLESIAGIGLLLGIVDGWKFVTTGMGFRGMVPGTAMVGDSICILNGGDVPFLLRKGGTHTDSYRLVGQCHITGIMNGEAVASRTGFPQVFHLY